MKITAHTQYGYLIEVSPEEIAELTGNFKDNRHAYRNRHTREHQESHEIGTELNISPTWKHIGNLLENEPQRQRIAESLRAAATLIEHTPSPITIPQAPTATEAA